MPPIGRPEHKLPSVLPACLLTLAALIALANAIMAANDPGARVAIPVVGACFMIGCAIAKWVIYFRQYIEAIVETRHRSGSESVLEDENVATEEAEGGQGRPLG